LVFDIRLAKNGNKLFLFEGYCEVQIRAQNGRCKYAVFVDYWGYVSESKKGNREGEGKINQAQELVSKNENKFFLFKIQYSAGRESFGNAGMFICSIFIFYYYVSFFVKICENGLSKKRGKKRGKNSLE
jgi:hypothetical protein